MHTKLQGILSSRALPQSAALQDCSSWEEAQQEQGDECQCSANMVRSWLYFLPSADPSITRSKFTCLRLNSCLHCCSEQLINPEVPQALRLQGILIGSDCTDTWPSFADALAFMQWQQTESYLLCKVVTFCTAALLLCCRACSLCSDHTYNVYCRRHCHCVQQAADISAR